MAETRTRVRYEYPDDFKPGDVILWGKARTRYRVDSVPTPLPDDDRRASFQATRIDTGETTTAALSRLAAWTLERA